MKHKTAIVKRKCESLIIYPLVLAGKIYGNFFPLKEKTSVFLFFPSADLGGSIKVNGDISHCIRDKKPLIIFSKKPKNNGFKKMFEPFRVIDLHKKIDNKIYHFVNIFYRGVLSSWINSADNAVVLGGECLYFYKVIPWLKKSVRKVEVCHLDTWFPYSIGFIEFIDHRVFSTLKMKEKVIEQYKTEQVEEKFFERLHFVENKIDIPPFVPVTNKKLEVIFVGRGVPQKRVPLIAAIAKKMHEKNYPVHFSFIGDVANSINTSDLDFCKFYGNVKDENLLNEIYQHSDVLILTSSYEGLPIVVMQMMVYGKVIVSTAVSAIPDYITHLQNGLLITATKEEEIIDEGVSLLKMLIDNPELKKNLGRRNREIAIEKFNGELFCSEYHRILFEK